MRFPESKVGEIPLSDYTKYLIYRITLVLLYRSSKSEEGNPKVTVGMCHHVQRAAYLILNNWFKYNLSMEELTYVHWFAEEAHLYQLPEIWKQHPSPDTWDITIYWFDRKDFQSRYQVLINATNEVKSRLVKNGQLKQKKQL